MSKLVKFTVEEMKGVPPFQTRIETDYDWFVRSNGDNIEWYYGGSYYPYMAEDEEGLDSIKCNPIDRMNALCKHLFELMPYLTHIELNHKSEEFPAFGVNYANEEWSEIDLSINPFLHTGKDSITREELGL